MDRLNDGASLTPEDVDAFRSSAKMLGSFGASLMHAAECLPPMYEGKALHLNTVAYHLDEVARGLNDPETSVVTKNWLDYLSDRKGKIQTEPPGRVA